ncbi:peptidase M16 inactive domain-containing protein [Microdochium trichocladiopsis]|uniref:Peptidase M16 inactive domain-containing protein n=1 Tax=Microdochium trichocladiopsis TaxID=1682393 RepID=A0A9P8Y0A5_9PEZI|nr:peptidase M16 inactive domain-containing protein [Microdochium trichocladiopsis]KAH7024472.1 peptidase M16 inactive domain-containing protein [Microdochium trichocladiopsis]
MATPPTPGKRAVELVTDKLDKPVTDDREYRVVRLPNQLEVLLASDATVDMASAALAVGVGSFRDGGIPGLAHAVEHLLFMGSEKYPADNDFKSFIGSHAGASNASTSPCATVYHFQVTADDTKASGDSESQQPGPSPFYGALDRFSQFFTSPLFLASTVDREINAVDSEFKLKYQSDDRRLFQLGRSLSNPQHPYNGFSTGNLKTLRDEPAEQGIEMRKRFVDFHRTHYSANLMKLCVLGKESLDTLQEWVATMFSDIPNKDLPQNRWEDVPLWSDEQLPRRVYTRPIMDFRRLRVSFPFLDEELLYENRPGEYLCKILGHEGEGSLLAYLKDKTWAASVSASTTSICPGTSGVLGIEVGLTEAGLEHHEDVAKAVFQYISMLQEDPSKLKDFVDESRHLADLAFYYRQKSESRTFTSSTCRRMQTQVPPKWYIGIGERAKAFDLELMTKALDLLRPSRTQIMLISQRYPGTWESKEKWYGTEYTTEPLPEQLLSELNDIYNNKTRPAELHLPAKNPFIPKNLEIDTEARAYKTPRLLKDTPSVRCWHKKDDTFLVPKAIITASLHNPAVYASATNEAHANLFAELVTDTLQTYAYAASLAGLHYSVYTGTRGLMIRVSGYNDKLPLLLSRVLAVVLRDLEIRGDRLEIFRERFLRACRNSELRKPCLQIPAYEPWLLSADFPSAAPHRLYRELVPALESVTVDSMRGFREQCLKRLFVEMYCHGNVTRQEAERITGIVEDSLRGTAASTSLPKAGAPVITDTDQEVSKDSNSALRQLEVLIPRALVIPRGVNFRYAETIRDPGDVNNCISYHIQLGPPSPNSLLPNNTVYASPSPGEGERPETTALRGLRARLQLICHILRPRVFHQLRTTEQLGYVVRTRMSASPGARGSRVSAFAIEVQTEKTPEYLEARIDAFLQTVAGPAVVSTPSSSPSEQARDGQETVLGKMTDSEFEAEKKGVVDKMLEKPKNMTQENDLFWVRIRDEGYDFEQAQKDAQHVLAVRKQDLMEFVRTYIAPGSSQRSTLAIYLRSHKAAEQPLDAGDAGSATNQGATTGRIDIKDIRDFKASLVADVGPRPVQGLQTYAYPDEA